MLICECVSRMQDYQNIPDGPSVRISYAPPKAQTFWLFKFYLSWKFQEGQKNDCGGNNELALRTVLEEAADMHPDTLFDCDFWFAYKEPLCLLSAREIVGSGCPYQQQVDLFSAWHFTLAPELLDALFKFLLDHNVDLCMCGCPGHKMTNRFTRMASLTKAKSARPGFPSAIQFVSLYFQNETLFRSIVRKYRWDIGTPATGYLELRCPSLLHCAILANSPMRVRVLLEEGCPTQLKEILLLFENEYKNPSSGIFHKSFLNTMFIDELLTDQCGARAINFWFYEYYYGLTASTPLGLSLMLASDIFQDPGRPDCAARLLAILQLLLNAANPKQKTQRGFNNENAKQEKCNSEPEIPAPIAYARDVDARKPVIPLTMLDLFVLYRNEQDANIIEGSPFYRVFHSSLFQSHLSCSFKEPYWRRILHTLWSNCDAFGQWCMLDFVRALVAAGVSLNVLIFHRNSRGENIAFPFLSVLAMFSRWNFFAKLPFLSSQKPTHSHLTPHQKQRKIKRISDAQYFCSVLL